MSFSDIINRTETVCETEGGKDLKERSADRISRRSAIRLNADTADAAGQVVC